MDDSIDPVTNTSLQKKKSKKKKKKIGAKNESDVLESPNSDVQEKQPQVILQGPLLKHLQTVQYVRGEDGRHMHVYNVYIYIYI